MELIHAHWERPLEVWKDPAKLTMQEQEKDIDDGVAKFTTWAKLAQSRAGEVAEYNLLNLKYFHTCSPSGRPDMADMLGLTDLLELLLSLGPHLKKTCLSTLLVSTHSQVPLRKPKCADDLYWLEYKAKEVLAFRSKCLLVKKYPDRIYHRLTLAGPKDLQRLGALMH